MTTRKRRLPPQPYLEDPYLEDPNVALDRMLGRRPPNMGTAMVPYHQRDARLAHGGGPPLPPVPYEGDGGGGGGGGGRGGGDMGIFGELLWAAGTGIVLGGMAYVAGMINQEKPKRKRSRRRRDD